MARFSTNRTKRGSVIGPLSRCCLGRTNILSSETTAPCRNSITSSERWKGPASSGGWFGENRRSFADHRIHRRCCGVAMARAVAQRRPGSFASVWPKPRAQPPSLPARVTCRAWLAPNALANFFATNVEINIDLPGHPARQFSSGREDVLQAALSARATLDSLKVTFSSGHPFSQSKPDKKSATRRLDRWKLVSPAILICMCKEMKFALGKFGSQWLITRSRNRADPPKCRACLTESYPIFFAHPLMCSLIKLASLCPGQSAKPRSRS